MFGDIMEKIICCLLPMTLLLKFFIKKEDKIINYVLKYFSLCFINNILCMLILRLYFKNVLYLSTEINFILKYSLMAIVIGIMMTVVYRITSNLIEIKLEVKNGKKRKN